MKKIEVSDEGMRDLVNEIEKSVGILEKTLSERKPSIVNEFYLTDVELSNLFKISRRTLQDYRTAGILPYYLVVGKVLYRESDIQKYLKDNYINAVKDITDLV